MDERLLILNAIKCKKENTPDIDWEFPGPDPLDKLVKRNKRAESFRRKAIEEWSNVDFLRYLDYMLKEFKAVRDVENTRRDSEKINTLHDKIVKCITIEMNNHILKEYLEWWCSIWAPRLTGSSFNLSFLIQDYQIARFVSRYKKGNIVESSPIVFHDDTVLETETVDDDKIYDLGGLALVIMKRGLVAGYRMLKKNGSLDAEQEIQDVIAKFNKNVFVNMFKITLQGSPYSDSDKIDFISLSLPILKRFGLTEYTQLSYNSYFSRSKSN